MVSLIKRDPAVPRLGTHEIVRPLARGGMAELFLARSTGVAGFEKVLVLKRLLPHLAQHQRIVRSFLDEAKLVAGFGHPHIAHVHDIGMLDGSYFFTMEFVHGVDVRTILKRCDRNATTLPITLSVLIARSIASALHYAHERRGLDGELLEIVHRDVSPSNIVVSYDGVPKLIDFGVAKAASSSMKTQTGTLKGKISYMSPEQAKGAPVDRRTDIFALGIVLWEMLANRRLYKSDNDMATIQRIIHEPAPLLRTVCPECPLDLERIVHRALALDINERYQTAQDLQVALEDFALEHRLKQSSIALSAELKHLFAEELEAWAAAQAGTATVTELPLGDTTLSNSISYCDLSPDEDAEKEIPAVSWPTLPNVGKPPLASASEAPAATLRSRLAKRISIGGASIIASIVIVVAMRSESHSRESATQAPTIVMRATPGETAPTISQPSSRQPAVVESKPKLATNELTRAKLVAKPATRKRTKAANKHTSEMVAARHLGPAVAPKPIARDVVTPKNDSTAAHPDPKPVVTPKQETKPTFDPNAVFPPSS